MFSNDKPCFPLSVFFKEDGEIMLLNSIDDAVCNLENMDSADKEYAVGITDKYGRKVHLVIVDLELVSCELYLTESNQSKNQ